MKIHLSFLLCNRWLLTFTLFAAIIQSAFAVDPIKEDPKFKAIVERFQTDFGAAIKLAQSKDEVVATNYEVRILEPAQLENAIKVLTWLETEYKRFPAGFFKKHGSKNLVLANAYVSKTWKGPGVPYSPTTISEKRSNSILVTVPSTFTPSSEFLAKSSIYHTVITYLLDDLKLTCHQKSPQYVKVVIGRKRQNIRGDEPCRSVRVIAENTRLVRSR